MTNQCVLSSYVYSIATSCKVAGVEDVVISPGSRSTPLAYAFASMKDEWNVYRHIDERAAGFFALGIAKAKGKPVVLICTSGTAAANYFPAIVEAHYSRVPLIVLTADRPHELREVGAPQTINQIQLYGEHVKWFAEFPIPDDNEATLPYVERHMARAAAIALAAPMGPVHINIPFREPLLIDFSMRNEIQPSFTSTLRGKLAPSVESKLKLKETLAEAKKGVIVIGELALNTDRNIIWQLIERLKWPVVVESLSNFRANVPEHLKQYLMTTYDALFKVDEVKQLLSTDTIIRFGAQPVSKFLMHFIASSNINHYIVVDEDPMFRDSISKATMFVHGEIDDWILDVLPDQPAQNEAYLKQWQQAEQKAQAHVREYADWSKDEGAYVWQLLDELGDGTDIFVSNSMPIRDIDTFFLPTSKDIRIIANRGANGIDGIVSTALGYSIANPNRKTVLLIGDLAMLHDSNAFIATRYQQVDLSVIVFNNDGGGIFSYLPQAKVEEHYEELFGTPTALQFQSLAELYGANYYAIRSNEELPQAMKDEATLKVIEIFTNRMENTANHRKLWQQIAKEFSSDAN